MITDVKWDSIFMTKSSPCFVCDIDHGVAACVMLLMVTIHPRILIVGVCDVHGQVLRSGTVVNRDVSIANAFLIVSLDR